jgi:hypothetical protein
MKKKTINWQKKLFDKYPDLFRQASLSTAESCMGRGIETEEGWQDIIEETCEKLIALMNSDFGKKHNLKIEFAGIKEKFAELRMFLEKSYKIPSTEAVELNIKRFINDKILIPIGRRLPSETHFYNFYLDTWTEVDKAVMAIGTEALIKSQTTCEICGEKGERKNRNGWLVCRCKKCEDK